MTPAEAKEWKDNVHSSFEWPAEATIVGYKMKWLSIATSKPMFGIVIDMGPNWGPDEGGPNDDLLNEAMTAIEGSFRIAGPKECLTFIDSTGGLRFTELNGWTLLPSVES